MSVSAVVLSYARTGNLKRIVDELNRQMFVDDIVVWHNGESAVSRREFDDSVAVTTVHSPNCFTWGRFLAARLCNHDVVLACDDDTLQRDWEAIYDAFMDDPRSIVAALKAPGHLNADKNNHWGTAHEVLLGWGSCFDRRWIAPAFLPYTEEYGTDTVLYRKADRIFSILLHRTHTVLPADIEELPGSTDPKVALYVREDHHKLTSEARRRALDLLGIKPSRRV